MEKTNDYNFKGPIPYGLTNDYMFRAVMQKHKNVLKHLLGALLDVDYASIKALEIKNPIELGEEINSKTCILDLKILLNNKKYINVEMQVVKQDFWKERSLTYLCKTYDNLDNGQSYEEVIPALQISILDFVLFEEVEELYSKYYLINENPEYANRYTNQFGIYVLSLPMLNNAHVRQSEQHTELYRWAKILKAESWEEICMLTKDDEALKECVYAMKEMSEDEKIKQQCEGRKDRMAIERGVYQRGMEAGQKQIAYNLLDLLDDETIAEKTGLSVEEVKEMRK